MSGKLQVTETAARAIVEAGTRPRQTAVQTIRKGDYLVSESGSELIPAKLASGWSFISGTNVRYASACLVKPDGTFDPDSTVRIYYNLETKPCIDTTLDYACGDFYVVWANGRWEVVAPYYRNKQAVSKQVVEEVQLQIFSDLAAINTANSAITNTTGDGSGGENDYQKEFKGQWESVGTVVQNVSCSGDGGLIVTYGYLAYKVDKYVIMHLDSQGEFVTVEPSQR